MKAPLRKKTGLFNDINMDQFETIHVLQLFFRLN